MDKKKLNPDYLFEVSWEICNKVGGINTVIATKALKLVEQLNDNFILIGPDIWRETRKNPVFKEDKTLFANWRKQATNEGLRIKIGRWDIVGNPIAILVDFTTFMPQKDEIFKEFWDKYQLDSISGAMDYIEAALFGYAAGKVIESFTNFKLSIKDNIVAQFHEWMSGAGILYLKQKTPNIATVFTTHATVVGRSIAGNGFPLYQNLKKYNGDSKAKELNVVAKHSMEKVSAKNADCFTTVSEITASECKQLLEKEIDIVTPNGFEDNFVPKGEEFILKQKTARTKLLEVAEATLNQEISEEALLVVNSGRYEFHNKGIDIFINSLAELNNRTDLNREVVAFILVPANNYGACKPLQDYLSGKKTVVAQSILTHGLHDPEYDSIYNEINNSNIQNKHEDKVKVIYVPSYLDGEDGIFDMKYYDLLIGFDLSIFPSYYEPWGYTPLESLAFHVPTITTNLAGIGMWVNKELVRINDGIEVFERTVGKDKSLISQIVEKIVESTHKSEYDIQRAKETAFTISKIALWKNLIIHYNKAFELALSKSKERPKIKIGKQHIELSQDIIERKINPPHWQSLMIQPKLPASLEGLNELSLNLWWTWSYEAKDLFQLIDPEIWESTENNPILLLKQVSHQRILELENQEEFMQQFNAVYQKFKDYIAEAQNKREGKIAYFCMEYGLSNILKIYSGGLGILAGDYLKEASDSNIDMVGVGFLYKYGYFKQQLSLKGEQMVSYESQSFSNLPINPVKDENGNWKMIKVAFPGRIVYARIWKVDVGRIKLYLLDTELDKNRKEDQNISHQLYGGNIEHRLKQEMLLGVGGVRALENLEIEPKIYHCNEGHAALLGLERIRNLMTSKKLTFAESLEIVRASTLFTTHTPVPAGHDAFDEDLVMVYMGHYPERLKINWDQFMQLGKLNVNDKNERFSMSRLAVNLSQEVNGVSMLHGEVTNNMFQPMWEGYYPSELHIGYVTNGVHYPSWAAKAWQELYRKHLSPDFEKHQDNKELWRKIQEVPDNEIWDIRQSERKKLINYIKERLSSDWIKRHVDPKKLLLVKNRINEKTLTIGFARRFATYKRAHLLFRDTERLAKILNNPERPVQFLFAGKAHPADKAGQDLIKHIVEISYRPEFAGHILFLQDYDISLAQKMVQGVDIWMNTPTRPLEASGTSGMKAVMNGVLNYSVLDGWWVEGYKENAGWELPLERTYENQDFQDELDAETIYNCLEQEITPLYYNRNSQNIPEGWVKYIKNCIAEIAPDFTTKRMLDDYIKRFYTKLENRTQLMEMECFDLAKTISSWKKRVSRDWDNIKIVQFDAPQSPDGEFVPGNTYYGKLILDLSLLNEEEIGVEIMLSDNISGRKKKIYSQNELQIENKDGRFVHYKIELKPEKAGILNYGIRIYAKNKLLPHRQDFNYVKWL